MTYSELIGREYEVLQNKLRTDRLGNFIGVRHGAPLKHNVKHINKLYR